jgi:hypothetical protein
MGIAGFLLSQSAYQAASLESSLRFIDTVEPIVAAILGIVGFHEHVAVDVTSVAIESIGAALAMGGVYVRGRSSLIVSAYGGAPVSS